MQMIPGRQRVGVVDLAELSTQVHGRVTSTQLTDDAWPVRQVTFDAGADWRAEVGAAAGKEWCEDPHSILVLSGSIRIDFLDGGVRYVRSEEFADIAGNHNAVASEQPCTFLEFGPPSGTSETISLCVLLWPHDSQDEAMAAYEDAVLALLPDHGGRLLARVRRSSSDGGPREVQIIELPDDTALGTYMADPRRTALAAVRDNVVARTDVIRINQPIDPA